MHKSQIHIIIYYFENIAQRRLIQCYMAFIISVNAKAPPYKEAVTTYSRQT